MFDLQAPAAQEPSFNLYDSVKESVKNLTPTIKDKIVESFAQKEVAKIEAATLKVLEMLDETRKEISKIKPDVVTYNEDATPATQTYSKAEVEKLKNSKEKLAKLQGALDSAFNSNDYKKVLDLSK